MRKLPLLVILLLPALPAALQDSSFAAARERMVREQIAARGVTDARVLEAMRQVPRHEFVPPALAAHAYEDRPLSIGHDQTISQPFIVAFMTEQLQPRPSDVVLEIGTGSGYQAAVLAKLCREVLSIELIPELAASARARLARLGYRNVQVRTGDGYAGWPERAPFTRIIVTAAPPKMPEALVNQLAVGGVMIAPVGDVFQELMIVRRTRTGIVTEASIPVRFVPMIRRPGR